MRVVLTRGLGFGAAWLAPLCLVWGCLGGSAVRADPEVAVAGNKQPRQPARFEPGPEIAPASELRLWLETHPDTRVRMPVTVDYTVLGVTGGRVGELSLSLDGTALGVSLHDHVRRLCAAPEGSCEVWLEGTPGALVDLTPSPSDDEDDDDDDAFVFAVRAVGDLVDPALEDVSRIQVAVSTGE